MRRRPFRPRRTVLICAILLAGVTACAPPTSPQPPTEAPTPDAWPAGREFVSRSIVEAGAAHPLVAGTRVAVRFDKPGTLRVYAGCNYLYVTGHLDGARIVADQLASTAIGCPEPLLAQDRWVTALFSAGPTWRLTGDEMLLRAGAIEVRLTDRAVADRTGTPDSTR